MSKEKVNSVLILDICLPESLVALQVLYKVLGIRTIVYSLDQFELQKPLGETFPEAFMIFTPTEKLLEKASEISCGLGYDLILDFEGTGI